MDKTDLYEFPVGVSGKFKLTGAGKRVGDDPGYRHITRTIDFWEIIVVERGILYMREGRRKFEVHPGGLLLMEPGKVHGGYRGHNADFFWLHFTSRTVKRRSPGFINVLKESRTGQPGQGICIPKHITVKQPRDLYRELTAYLECRKNAVMYREERLLNHFRDILFILLDDLAARGGAEPVKDTQVRHVWRIMQFLGEHFARDVTVEEITARTGLNRDYANRIFKAANGCSIKEYHLQLRVDKARSLLENENMPIVRIAEAVGYEDQYYFSRLFKQKMGMSPRKYRETIYKVRNR